MARPFSGDVVSLDTANLEVIERAVLGRQPLMAVGLSDGRVIARDWKTGDWISGNFGCEHR